MNTDLKKLPANNLDEPAHRWKHYPEYKDSGVEWLGEVPEHWEICTLRRKLRNGNEGIKIGPFGSQLKLEFMEESGYKIYGQEHVISGDFNLGSKYIPDIKYQELSSCSINPGDLLVSMMGTSGRCQKVPTNIEPGIMDSHLLRLRVRANELDSSFIALLIDQAYYVIEQLKASGKGSIMHGLNSTLVKEIILGIPTLSEQRVITSFLDRQAAHLDALISKKERFIALLEEQRSALISHAVTKGLDPNVPMKDSGMEWLGEVPENWFLVPLKRAFFVQLGKMLQSTPASSEDTLEPYLRAANIFWSGVDLNDVNRMWFSPYEKQQYNLKVDDLLVSEGGDVGRTAIWKGEIENCYIQNAVNRVRSKGIHSTHFLFYWMYSLKHCGYIDMLCNKATIAHFTAEKVEQVNIILPPSPEQRTIAVFLDRETARIDALILKVREGIEKLKEYRTALISAAVTGKIDVLEEINR